MNAKDALLRALREEHHPEYWGGERDEAGLVAAFEAEVLAWQRAYVVEHPEAGTLELIEAAAKELAPSCRWPACLSEKQQRLLAAQVDAGMRGEPTVPMPDQRLVCGCIDRGINIDPLPSDRNAGGEP